MRRGIYVITCLASGHQYVGSSVNIDKRWKHHREDLRGKKHHSRALQRAWNKWGSEQFRWEVVEETPDNVELVEREKIWHRQLKPVYNCLVPDRSLKNRHSMDSRERMSQSNLAAWERRRSEGRDFLTAEHRANIGASHVGIRPNEDTRRKMSDAAKRRIERERPKQEALRVARIVCAQGHLWISENTYTYTSTGRTVCLICKRNTARKTARQRHRTPEAHIGRWHIMPNEL